MKPKFNQSGALQINFALNDLEDVKEELRQITNRLSAIDEQLPEEVKTEFNVKIDRAKDNVALLINFLENFLEGEGYARFP